MKKCTKCGHENNDGAVYCLNCKSQLSRFDAPSEFYMYMHEQTKVETEHKKARVKLIATVISIYVLFTVAFTFYEIRVKTAPDRAKEMVCDYIDSHFPTVGDYNLLFVYGNFKEGFRLSGYIVVSGFNMELSAKVEMKGIFDFGRITSIKIAGTEFYKT